MDQQLLIDNGIDIEKGIQFIGDKETYDEFLGKFLVESEKRIPSIKQFKEALDLPNYIILVHAMKSDAKYLGFTKLAELSQQHEMESRALNDKYVNEHFDELMNEADRIISIVKQYLGKA